VTIHPLEFPYFYGCLVGVMLAWATFTLAFVLVRPQTPPASDAPKEVAGATVGRTRDRRSVIGVALQSIGYFFMWLSFRPPFPTLSLLPGAPALIVATLAVVLAMAAGFLAVWARRTLGREWSFEARLVESHRMGHDRAVRDRAPPDLCGDARPVDRDRARSGAAVGHRDRAAVHAGRDVDARDDRGRAVARRVGEAFEGWARRTPAVIPFARR
jgi:hypothetical protein